MALFFIFDILEVRFVAYIAHYALKCSRVFVEMYKKHIVAPSDERAANYTSALFVNRIF